MSETTDPATPEGSGGAPRFRAWEQRFLDALRRKGSVQAAALVVGISPRAAYNRRKKSPAFARDWDLTVNAVNDQLEASAYERAVHGVPRARFYKDRKIADEVEYPDGLTAFLLEKRMPDKYGRHAVAPEDDAERAAKMVAAVAAMRATVAPPPELATLTAELAALRAEVEALRAARAAAPAPAAPKPKSKRKRRPRSKTRP